jgi:ubiquinone/menaquinone biosynthesis C-methylase UbiE
MIDRKNDLKENNRPISHKPPIDLLSTIRFTIRLSLDFQVLSVYRNIKPFLAKAKGNLLDLGCGESPYRFLVNELNTTYFGADIADSDKFDYNKPEIAHFDGKKIPFETDFFDVIICTEVLEHVDDYQTLINDMYRVLKPNGVALITIPWSARFHYIPYDFFRYSPTSLKKMFAQFNTTISARGTDITAIASKLIVLFVRNIFPKQMWRYIFSPLWILFSPIVMLAVIAGHISLLFPFGSDNDPLGYTILLKKE